MSAALVEIFSSIQGEGLRLGEMQTFVRFQGCSLRCRWCDTPENFNPKKKYRIESVPFSGKWKEESNPVSSETLLKILEHFKNYWVSLTGGEPLEQLEFLQEFLPLAKGRFKFLLETGGFLPEALEKIVSEIDCVSMDIKLPSSAKTGEYWDAHHRFLKIAQRAPQVYVKIVVTQETDLHDFEQALKLISEVNKLTPVIIQPVSAIKGFDSVPQTKIIFEFYELAKDFPMPVKIIPQVHKYMKVS